MTQNGSPSSNLFASEDVLIFDGGMGTELYERGFYINRPFEELNVQAAADVIAVHEDYIRAGAQILTTNTFSITRPQLRNFDIQDQQVLLLEAALRNANRARKDQPVRIGLSIGPLGEILEPLGPFGLDEAREEFRSVASAAVEAARRTEDCDFELYILETFSQISELEAAVSGIRQADPLRPILASLTVKSTQSEILLEFAQRLGKRADVEALGLNCSEGPSDLLSSLKKLRVLTNKPIVVQPNAGVPRQLNGRYFYMTSPDYLAKYTRRFIEAGAQGVGGCCGTGPDHVRAIRGAARMMNAKRPGVFAEEAPGVIETRDGASGVRKPLSERKASKIAQLLTAGKKIISIEVVPPRGTEIEPFLARVQKIADAGIPLINVPDGARAMTRVSSLHVAALIQKRMNGTLHVIPHLTTRDRNLIALQSDLLGASVNGVNDLLLVTGDPPKLGNNREATAVYDIDSIGLTYLADCLNRGVSPGGETLGSGTQFGIGVASNPTSVNPELEMQRWIYKVQSGADFSITQPIFDPESFLRWRDSIQEHYRPHVVGIWPLVSLRNAEFMAHEVPGVHVPEWVLAEMEKAGENREEAIRRGVEIAQRTMRALEKDCEGFCISAPLGKVEVALEVASHILGAGGLGDGGATL